MLAFAGAPPAWADMAAAIDAYNAGRYGAAFQEFGQLAGSGDMDAAVWLGFLYQQGQGTAQDFAQAMHWFSRAADAGNAEAMVYVGHLYYYGHGVAKDLIE